MPSYFVTVIDGTFNFASKADAVNPAGPAPDSQQNKGQPQAAAGQGASPPADSDATTGQRSAKPRPQQQGDRQGEGRRRSAQ